MPRRPKPEKRSVEDFAPIPPDVLDQIVRDGPLTAAEVETATPRFKKARIERALGAELIHHLGYVPGTSKPDSGTNHRNGTSSQTVLTDDGPVTIDVPRDREGTFEPQLIGKQERRLTGFDDKVIALYARGLTSGRSATPVAIFRMTRPPPSCCGSRGATSPPPGARPPTTGIWR